MSNHRVSELLTMLPRERSIQIAHDMLVAVLEGTLPNPWPGKENQERLMHYTSVLCWVLGHIDEGSPGAVFSEELIRLTDLILEATGRRLTEQTERHRKN